MSSPQSPRRSTLQAVARKAGVSHSTVSLILNGRGKELRISDETCKKVIAVAKELNYEANYFARSLKGKSTHTLAILWFFSGPHSEDGVIRRVTEQALKHGYIAHFFDSLSDSKTIIRILQELSRRSVDGVILRTSNRDFVESEEVKRLLANFRAAVIVAQDFDAPCRDIVQHMRIKAMNDAVEHFVKTDRKRLVLLGGNHPKFEVARNAWLALGKRPRDIVLLDVDWYRATDRLKSVVDSIDSVPWGGPKGFDSLLCSADEMAFISINHFRTLGISVPEDVSVIGFNDSLAAQFFTPPVASVARGDISVADAALELLFARLNEPALPPQRANIEMELILRASALIAPKKLTIKAKSPRPSPSVKKKTSPRSA